jgi:hypothetical protein
LITTLRLATAAILFSFSPVFAQEAPVEEGQRRFSFEIRGELAKAVGSFDEVVGDDLGSGFGAAVRLWLTGSAALYGGWDWFQFDDIVGDTATVGETAVELTDPGFRGGVLFQMDSPGRQLEPFLYAGVITTKPKLEETSPTDVVVITKYERSLGGEVGGGLVIPLGRVISLVPEARFRFHNADAPSDAAAPDLETKYVGFNVGLVFVL